MDIFRIFGEPSIEFISSRVLSAVLIDFKLIGILGRIVDKSMLFYSLKFLKSTTHKIKRCEQTRKTMHFIWLMAKIRQNTKIM